MKGFLSLIKGMIKEAERKPEEENSQEREFDLEDFARHVGSDAVEPLPTEEEDGGPEP